MELRHFRYFVAVAEAGSLTVAAEERLHTSRSVLSQVDAATEAARRVAHPPKPCFTIGFLTGHDPPVSVRCRERCASAVGRPAVSTATAVNASSFGPPSRLPEN